MKLRTVDEWIDGAYSWWRSGLNPISGRNNAVLASDGNVPAAP
jgi:hypothetical protein